VVLSLHIFMPEFGISGAESSYLYARVCRLLNFCNTNNRRSQRPRGLRRKSVAAHLLRSWVRIPPGGMDVCCEFCVLSGRGLCDELITYPEKSYRLWCVVLCYLKTYECGGPGPLGELLHQIKRKHKQSLTKCN
jgi:hypothetical protein